MTVEYPVLPYFRCLNEGFVALVDVMGDDSSVVQAARVSYGKGVKTTEEDERLISYLMRNRHTSPFEMVEFKFLCRMPIFVARQWIRHRTANVNEYSGRYSVMKDSFFIPHPGSIAPQSEDNKQGRVENFKDEFDRAYDWCCKQEGNAASLVEDLRKASDEPLITQRQWARREAILKHIPDGLTFAGQVNHKIREANEKAWESYQALLSLGVAKEIARVLLPLTTYTEWYWKIDLHNLLHFLRLRLDKHAQAEIRVYAEAITMFVAEKCPVVWRAFSDSLHGCMLTSQEKSAIAGSIHLDEEIVRITSQLKDDGFTDRRIKEFWEKVS
jgi:thymidylate synthase (FAD)